MYIFTSGRYRYRGQAMSVLTVDMFQLWWRWVSQWFILLIVLGCSLVNITSTQHYRQHLPTHWQTVQSTESQLLMFSRLWQ